MNGGERKRGRMMIWRSRIEAIVMERC